MVLPSNTHVVGDPEHTEDHNRIIDAILALQQSLATLALTGAPAGAVWLYATNTLPSAAKPFLWLNTSDFTLNYVYDDLPVAASRFAFTYGGATFAGAPL